MLRLHSRFMETTMHALGLNCVKRRMGIGFDHSIMQEEYSSCQSSSETGCSQCSSDSEEIPWIQQECMERCSTEWIIFDAEHGNWNVALKLPNYIYKDMPSLTLESEWLGSKAYSGLPCTLKDVKEHETRQLLTAEKKSLALPGPGNTATLIQCDPESGQISMILPNSSAVEPGEERWSRILATFILGTPEEWKIYFVYEPSFLYLNGENLRLWCITVTPALERLGRQLRPTQEIISYCSQATAKSGLTAIKERARLLSMISTGGSVTDYCLVCWTDIGYDCPSKDLSPTRTGRRSTLLPTTPRISGIKRGSRVL